MSAGLTRRQLLRAAVPAATGLAGAALGAFGMFGLTDDPAPRPPKARRTAIEEPRSDRAIPTTGALLLAFTRPLLDPALEPAARSYDQIVGVSIVRGGIADLFTAWDGAGRLVEEHEPGWAVPLEAMAVDPALHAEFVPEPERAAWTTLGDGQILLGRTSARLRGLEPGGTIELVGGAQLVVAAIVDDATIGAAELGMTATTAAGLGLDTHRYMLVTYDGDRGELESYLRDVLPKGTQARFRGPGEAPFMRQGEAVLAPLQIKAQFGEFAYQRERPETEDDTDFFQSSEWIDENLVRIDLPIIGEPATCHRGVADAIVGALNEIGALNLSNLLEPAEYKGCYNPRFVRDNPWDISRHAWGIAIDLNFESNRTGTQSIQDSRVIEVFRRWGFTEGSNWLRPDAGHFEYAATS